MRAAGLRSCVDKSLNAGADDAHEFKKMRHAIIYELNRLGLSPGEIKDELLAWHQRSKVKLGMGDQRRQLLDYVDWFMKKECKLSCKALEDYCIGKSKCKFISSRNASIKKHVNQVKLDLNAMEKFLAEKYGPAQALTMICIIQAMKRFQLERQAGELIMIGYRQICSIIRDTKGFNFSTMDILRRIRNLEDEKILQLVERGKSGTTGFKKSNAYKILPWRVKASPLKKREHAISPTLPISPICVSDGYTL